MAATYYTLLTTVGQAQIANAIMLSQKVNLTHMAVGDGNGNPTTPNENQTSLVNEVYRAQVNQLSTDPDNASYLIAEMIVPTNVGGWSVREVGLFDSDENLIAVANFPETYKPKLEEGSGRDLIIRIILQVRNAEAITLKIDPAIILASQSWVIENFSKGKLFPGGRQGQVLTKLSDHDGDTAWQIPWSEEMASKTDKATAAHAAMPSQHIIDLAANSTASNTMSCTAPADGYVTVYAIRAQATDGKVILVGNTSNTGVTSIDNTLQISIAVSKGEVVTIIHYNVTFRGIKFVYANGTD